jgi:hypothetical protein
MSQHAVRCGVLDACIALLLHVMRVDPGRCRHVRTCALLPFRHSSDHDHAVRRCLFGGVELQAACFTAHATTAVLLILVAAFWRSCAVLF